MSTLIESPERFLFETWETEEPIDFSDTYHFVDWVEQDFLQFAEYLGYTIEENPKSSLGYSVTGPSGKKMRGFIARRIINAWKNKKEPEKGIDSGGRNASADRALIREIDRSEKAGAKKGGGGKGGGGKGKAAEDPAVKLAEFIAQLDEFELKIPDMVEQSKGLLAPEVLSSFLEEVRKNLASATDPKQMAEIMKDFKANVDAYKNEMTKPPTVQERVEKARASAKAALPLLEDFQSGKYADLAMYGALLDATKAAVDSATDGEAITVFMADFRAAVQAQQAVEKGIKERAGNELKILAAASKTGYQDVLAVAPSLGWEPVEVIKPRNAVEEEMYRQQTAIMGDQFPDSVFETVDSAEGIVLLAKKFGAFAPVAAPMTASELAESWFEATSPFGLRRFHLQGQHDQRLHGRGRGAIEGGRPAFSSNPFGVSPADDAFWQGEDYEQIDDLWESYQLGTSDRYESTATYWKDKVVTTLSQDLINDPEFRDYARLRATRQMSVEEMNEIVPIVDFYTNKHPEAYDQAQMKTLKEVMAKDQYLAHQIEVDLLRNRLTQDEYLEYTAKVAEKRPPPSDHAIQNAAYSIVDEHVRAWAESSTDSNRKSLAMQRAASEFYGSGNKDDFKKFYENGMGFDSKHDPVEIMVAKKILQTQYKHTQQLFEENGIKEVTLHRGIIVNEPIAKWLDSDPSVNKSRTSLNPNFTSVQRTTYSSDRVLLEANPLSSYSYQPSTASSFGELKIHMVVPVSEIVSTPFTGSGCLNEGEFVVLNRNQTATLYGTGFGEIEN